MHALRISRRELVGAGAVAVGTAIAGCIDGSTADVESSPDPADSIDPVADPVTASIRGETESPLVRLATEADADSADEAGTSDGYDADDADADADLDTLLVLTDDADREALEYDRDRDGGGAVRELLAETTFGEESVIVYQGRIGECYERRLDYAEADAQAFDLRFCQVERDASVACELEREQLQATFVRVPVAFDSEPSSQTIGVSSSCRTTSRSGEDEPGERTE